MAKMEEKFILFESHIKQKQNNRVKKIKETDFAMTVSYCLIGKTWFYFCIRLIRGLGVGAAYEEHSRH